MHKQNSAPLLGRIKSWQLVGLGLSGWCTLYSCAILTFGAGSALIGNVQGGCFAATMTLAGREAKRFRSALAAPDPLAWTFGVTTGQVNQAIAQSLRKNELRVEVPKTFETELGFGVRAVSTGRTMVYETSRWQEPVIDVAHVQATEENRKKIAADVAFIVGLGEPDEAALEFSKSSHVNFLVGDELKDMLKAETPTVEIIYPA